MVDGWRSETEKREKVFTVVVEKERASEREKQKGKGRVPSRFCNCVGRLTRRVFSLKDRNKEEREATKREEFSRCSIHPLDKAKQ